MEAFARLLNALSIPLALINLLGGIVSGIWLAVLGEWGSIGWGFVFLFGGAIAISLAMLPGLLVMAPVAYFHDKGPKAAFYLFGFLGSLYTIAVITAWCCVVLVFFNKRADSSSLIPLLIWSYGAATAPLSYMAQKEQNEYSAISTFFAQLGYLIVIATLMLTRITIVDAFVIIGAVMSIGLVFQSWIAFNVDRTKSAAH